MEEKKELERLGHIPFDYFLKLRKDFDDEQVVRGKIAKFMGYDVQVFNAGYYPLMYYKAAYGDFMPLPEYTENHSDAFAVLNKLENMEFYYTEYDVGKDAGGHYCKIEMTRPVKEQHFKFEVYTTPLPYAICLAVLEILRCIEQ